MQTDRFPFREMAEALGDAPALIGADRAITYNEYCRLINIAAANLIRLGIKREDRLGIISSNSIEYILLLMAVFQIGAVACPISPRFPSKTIASMLKKINCTKLITEPHQHSGPYNDNHIELPSLWNRPEGSAGTTETSAIDDNQDATIIFTSGSSATPKAVLHTFGNHYYNALGANENMLLEPGDRWLLSLPLYHVGGIGILFRCLLSGAAVVVPAANEMLTESISNHQISHVSLVATQLNRLLDEIVSEKTTASPRNILIGGGSIPKNLVRRAHAMGLTIFTSYGLTEMASQVTTTAADDPPEKLFTSGRPLAHREAKLSPNGEILVRGKTRFKGYVEAGALITPFDGDGWFGTSDLGKIDANGYLTAAGRRDNMFISGGENIQPEEIEGSLARIGAIEEAVVVPVKHDDFGHRPVAFIKTKPKQKISAEEIILLLEDHLPRFKIPDHFYRWPDAVDQTGLKPSRQDFVEMAEQLSQTRDL
jgi:O-succinylbenzoic acid--CoA ligase